jgi:hypothetical protein
MRGMNRVLYDTYFRLSGCSRGMITTSLECAALMTAGHVDIRTYKQFNISEAS